MQRSASTRGLRRASLLAGVALFALAVAGAIAFATPASAPDVPVVDLTGEVTQESCSPCHVRLDEAETPGLVFSHGTHILFACASCHPSMPHEAGRTERPAMATCFTCHGVPHTAGSALASGQCETCHTPQFRLRPRTHTDDWAAEPHARATVEDGVNQCMLCHYAPRDCDACHTELAADVPRMPPAYIASVPTRPDRAPVRIALGGPVTPSQCVFCHYDIDDFAPGRIIFYHDDHLVLGVGCRACHAVFPHTAEGTARNTMAACYRCHSLAHSERGLVATEECGACHPPAFELVPVNHTPDFAAREHPAMVEEDETYCTLCHKGPFCQECHRAGRTMADGTPARYVIPDDHAEVAWLSEHGRRFLDAAGTCWACHDSPSCERCHQTPTPHPSAWLTAHGESEFSTRPENDCDICHTDRRWCQDCHHEEVRHVYLVEENCVACHEEMATMPRTQLRDRKLAPHAVHFEVEEVKGRPYRCYECHVTWGAPVANGAAREHVGSPVELGHDLRICYDCHGALDFRRVLIAPWPGAQLCGRCHAEGPVAELGRPGARLP
ncbi:MAG TPA: cytochrome c3 family protein [Coriobacteriia bacterium]|nr:cytochrome c3 family protein [Coriobacteriia bacterium]